MPPAIKMNCPMILFLENNPEKAARL